MDMSKTKMTFPTVRNQGESIYELEYFIYDLTRHWKNNSEGDLYPLLPRPSPLKLIRDGVAR
jgi:hypothetical protein